MERLRIDGLFGYATREVTFSATKPTVFTGINGTGKTQTLKAIDAILRLNISQMFRLPMKSAEVTFKNGVTAGFINSPNNTNDANGSSLKEESIQVFLRRGDDSLLHSETVSVTRIRELEQENVASLDVESDHAYRTDYLSPTLRNKARESLRQRFGSQVDIRLRRRTSLRYRGTFSVNDLLSVEIISAWPSSTSITIDTKRLDSASDAGSFSSPSLIGMRERDLIEGRISLYLDMVLREIMRAERVALGANQSSDRSFASRALDAARETVHESLVRRRYKDLADRSAVLAGNSLQVGDAPPELKAESLNPTERRILSVFLDDWEERIRPLEPISEKVSLFKRVVGSKLEVSHKSIDIQRDNTPKRYSVVVRDSRGDQIEVTDLSSGEQHLVALYARLIFGTEDSRIVLIDEPEISLHPAWQHSFISDLDLIASLVPMQVIIATHSPSIIHNHWDMECVLDLPVPPAPRKLDGLLREPAQADDDADLFEDVED